MTSEEQAPPRPPAVDDQQGGESACLLDRVCPDCGRLADTAPPTDCPRCGTRIGD